MDDLQKLLEQSNSTDLATLLSAKEEAKRRVLSDPTPANLAALQRASTMIEAYYAGKEQIFKTRMDVLQYLKDQGYKIEKSKLYRDCEKGLLKVETNGTVKKSSIDIYIMHPLANIGADGTDNEDLKERTDLELRRLRGQAEQIEFRNKVEQGLYVLKDYVMRALASRALVFKNDLISFFRTHAAPIIVLVGGDPAKAPDLIDYCIEHLEMFLSRYALDIEFSPVQPTEEETETT